MATDGTFWRQVPNDGRHIQSDEGDMYAVAAGGPGLVAVGQDGGEAAVWTSPDGSDWQRVPHDPRVFGDGDSKQIMRSVAAGGPGLVAVGEAFLEGVAVWTSPDGLDWQRVPHDPRVFGDGGTLQSMRSVAAGGPGLVAVGHDGLEAAVWVSSDGSDWQRVPHDFNVFGGKALGDDRDHVREMRSVVAGGPGLVAVGVDSIRSEAAVWTSAAGFEWRRVPNNHQLFAGEMNAVAVGGPGLVAVGQGAFGGAVWVSSDGLGWQRAHHDPQASDDAASGGEREMLSVAAGGPGLVAVGVEKFDHRAYQAHAVVWTSPDGFNWQRAPHAPQVFGDATSGRKMMRSVVAGGPGLIAVGVDGDPSDAAVWSSP